MIISTSRQFDKQFVKLPLSVKLWFKAKVEIFRHNPFDSQLRNHTVKGKKYQGYRSVDITGDIRALYIERHDGVVVFGFIGSHSQLY